MTQEEKAKAYDEALERARKMLNMILDNELLGFPDQIREIFPQLRESEDEKIIDTLIWLVEGRKKSRTTAYGDVKIDDILAWLKKQKEQKPDSLIYDKDLDKAAREFYLSGGAASPVDSTGLVPIVRMAEFGATWMKERMEKEQKPCWNPTEEDVALFNKAITTNASLSPQERAKLDILRMKFKHRPVIEQKEQKSAEWSKEDEKKINFLSRLIEFQVKDDEYCFSEGRFVSKQEAIEMLKSLRPSWKPSKEQMKAFTDFVVGNEYDAHALAHLWAELKELSERLIS